MAAAGLLAPVDLAQAQDRAGTVAPFAGAPHTFADIVERVKPAVVSIKVTSGGEPVKSTRWTPRGRGDRGDRRSEGALPFPDLAPDHPLNELFKHLPREFRGGPGGRPAPHARRSQGSGFVISEDGYVVTNNHVIRGGTKITVSFDDKENLPAEIIGADPRTDLALLKIKANRKFKFVRFATKQSRVGDWVVAVGNPFGLGGTVTVGVVSAHGRSIGSGPYDYLQIDAAVNRGNSGGPSFNLAGEVIGVNTAIYTPSRRGGNVGIAFAVPAKTAIEVIDQLRKKGRVDRGWLGVRIQTITDDIASSLGLKEAHGALISQLTKGGPAEKGGLREGDAILTINGSKVADSRDLARKIASINPGSSIAVGIRRAGSNMTVNVNLGTFPTAQQQPAAAPRKQEEPQFTALRALGLELSEMRPDYGRPGATPAASGVVVRDVDPASDAAQKGIQAGDVITAVNGQRVMRPSDVDQAVRSAQQQNRKAVLLSVRRGSAQTFIAVQLSKDK
ncbi:MAG: Do family serine endopeptidase [Hyphomicrobiaceae bacterium]|nr:Do family serine endopeptidase [Hyphomicrobiaceae bacterium]